MMSCTSRARRHWLVAGVTVAAMALGLLAAPGGSAAHADARSRERLDLMREAHGGDGARAQRDGEVSAQQAEGSQCFTDARGDVVEEDTGAATSRAEAPRADVVEHCVAYEENLTVQVQVAEPTNPRTDANWRNATFAGWFLDATGDGEGDFFVGYHLDGAGDLVAEVQDVREEESSTTCPSVGAAYDGTTYTAGPIEPACIDGAETVTAAAGVFYDVDGDAGPLLRDTAPDDDSFTPAVERSEGCEDPMPAPFADRDDISDVHRHNVDCLYARGVTLGQEVDGVRTFAPHAAINRGQFSAFTFRALGFLDVALPDAQRPRFEDVGEAHTFDEEIHRLAAADILLGQTPTRFNPGGFIRRDQTASVLLRALEHARGADIPPQNPGGHFRDTEGNIHSDNIDAAFEQELVRGVKAPTPLQRGIYEPAARTSRQQMASVINRFVDVTQAP